MRNVTQAFYHMHTNSLPQFKDCRHVEGKVFPRPQIVSTKKAFHESDENPSVNLI